MIAVPLPVHSRESFEQRERERDRERAADLIQQVSKTLHSQQGDLSDADDEPFDLEEDRSRGKNGART